MLCALVHTPYRILSALTLSNRRRRTRNVSKWPARPKSLTKDSQTKPFFIWEEKLLGILDKNTPVSFRRLENLTWRVSRLFYHQNLLTVLSASGERRRPAWYHTPLPCIRRKLFCVYSSSAMFVYACCVVSQSKIVGLRGVWPTVLGVFSATQRTN